MEDRCINYYVNNQFCIILSELYEVRHKNTQAAVESSSFFYNEDCITDGKPNPLKLNPIIMMGASYYSLDEVVGNLFRTGLKLSENK